MTAIACTSGRFPLPPRGVLPTAQIQSRQHPRQGCSTTDYAKRSSINLVSIFRCSSPQRNPVYPRRVDPSACDNSLFQKNWRWKLSDNWKSKFNLVCAYADPWLYAYIMCVCVCICMYIYSTISKITVRPRQIRTGGTGETSNHDN